MSDEKPLTPTHVRVLAFLEKHTAYTDRYVSAQGLASHLWPGRRYSSGRNMKAGVILAALQRKNLVGDNERGWFITTKGTAALQAAKGEADDNRS